MSFWKNTFTFTSSRGVSVCYWMKIPTSDPMSNKWKGFGIVDCVIKAKELIFCSSTHQKKNTMILIGTDFSLRRFSSGQQVLLEHLRELLQHLMDSLVSLSSVLSAGCSQA